MKYLITVCAILTSLLVSNSAEARKRYRTVEAHPMCNVTMPCEGVVAHPRGEAVVQAMGGFGSSRKFYKQRVAKADYREGLRQKTRQRAPVAAPAPTKVASYGAPGVSLSGTLRHAGAYVAAQMLPHPAGCPRRAFCGCGAAQEVGKSSDRSLWLAANWLRFPRTAPASGMAAARRGHVFVLRSHVSGSKWLVVDHNSGGRRSRLHVRDVRGYSIVNPHA